MDLPQRKPNRLREYDYSQAGGYFITICTQDRKNLFWAERVRQEADSLPYTSYGDIVDRAIRAIPDHYVGVAVDKFVVMPNHIHLILRLSGSAQTTVSTVIGQLKRAVSRQISRPVWQRSFYDHVIRNEADYREIWEYIENNPRKWAEDCFYTELSSERKD